MAFQPYVVPDLAGRDRRAVRFQSRRHREGSAASSGPVMVNHSSPSAFLGVTAIPSTTKSARARPALNALHFTTRTVLAGFTILGGVVAGRDRRRGALRGPSALSGRQASYRLVQPGLSGASVLNYFAKARSCSPIRTRRPIRSTRAGAWLGADPDGRARDGWRTVIASQAFDLRDVHPCPSRPIATETPRRACSSPIRRTATRDRSSCRPINLWLAVGCANLVNRISLPATRLHGVPACGGRSHHAMHVLGLLRRDLQGVHWERWLSMRSSRCSWSSTQPGARVLCPSFPDRRRLDTGLDQRRCSWLMSLTWLERATCLAKALADQQTRSKRSSRSCRPALATAGRLVLPDASSAAAFPFRGAIAGCATAPKKSAS